MLPAPRVPAFAPLRHRDFRLLWIGLVISNTGSWMQFVALGYLVDRLTQSPLYLGILAFAQAVPRLMFALVGGTAADRMDRRRVLLATNLFLLISAGVLGLLTATGRIQIWQVLVLGALNSLVQSFDVPARHSLVPQLVEEREVLTAVTLNSVAFNGSGIFGPSLGGVIIAAAGEAGCFYLNAASFLAVVAALWVMTVPSQQAPSRAPLSDDLRESVQLLRADRRLRRFLGALLVLSFFGRPYIRMMPAFAREVLHVGATSLGLLQAAPGAGTLAAVLLVGRVSEARGMGVLLGTATLIFGILVAAFGVVPSFHVALALLVLIGTAQSLALSTANTLIQLAAPPHARGRLMGLYSMVTFGGFALGSLPVGAAADVIGVGPAVSLGGVIVVLLAIWFLPRLRDRER